MKIRHEINIFNRPRSLSAGDYETVLLDTTKYSGTCTFYLEVYVTSATTTCSLRRAGTSTDDVTISSASAGTLVRSSSFTPPTGTTAYICYNTGTGFVKAARIIIIQDTGSAPLTASESQIEIGNYETGKSNTTIAALTAPKYYKHTAANWNGTLTSYSEVVYVGTGSMYLQTFRLQKSLDLSTWTDVVTIVNAAATSTTMARTRSASFTLEDGYYYRLAGFISNNMETYSVYSAKIIIQQTSIGAGQTTATGANAGTLQDFSTITAHAQSFKGSTSVDKELYGVNIYCGKSSSPSGTTGVALTIRDAVDGTILATSKTVLWGSIAGSIGDYRSVFFELNSPITLTANVSYFIQFVHGGWSGSFYWSYESSDLYANGSRNQKQSGSWTNSPTHDHAFSLVHEFITKLEEQYLLANTTLAAGTSLQGFLTKWDSADWSDVDNIYVHQVAASDNNTSVVEIDTAAGVQVVNSVITSPDNFGTSNNFYTVDSFTESAYDSTTTLSSTLRLGAGQCFNSDNGGVLNRVSFYLSKSNTPTGNAVAKIYALSGTYGTNAIPTGSALATSDNFDVSALTTTIGLKEFSFSGAQKITLSPSTNYFVSIEYSGGDSFNFVTVGLDSTSPAHGGNHAQLQSGTWTAFSSIDTIFYLSVDGAMTMPANGNLDVKATTNSGNIYASGVIVAVSKITSINTNASPALGQVTVTGFAPTISVTTNTTTNHALGQALLTGFVPTVNISVSVSLALGQALLTGFAPQLKSTLNIPLGQLTLTGFEPTVSVSNNQSVSPALGSLLATGFEPTVNIIVNQTASPALGVLLITGFAPQVNRTVITDLGALTLTGFSPTINVSDHKIIQTDVGSLLATGLQPSVTISNNQSASPALGQLLATGLQPSVAATDHKTIQTDIGVLLATGFAPTISISDHKSVSPGTGELLIAGFAPNLNAADHKVASPDTGQVELNGLPPQVNLSLALGLGALTVTGYEPTIQISQSAHPALGQVIITGFLPTINVSDNKSVSPALGSLIVTGYNPIANVSHGTGQVIVTGYAPQVNRTVIAGFGQLQITGYSPTVNISQSVHPNTASAIITGFEPTAQIAVIGSFGVGQLIATGFEPTILISQSAAPGTGQVLVTGHAPQVNKTLLTGVGQLTITGYSPIVNITQSVHPATGQVIAQGYSPTIQVSVSGSIGVGQLLLEGYAPTVNITASATPGTGSVQIDGYAPVLESKLYVGLAEGLFVGYAPNVQIGAATDTVVIVGVGQLIITGYAPSALKSRSVIVKSHIDSELIIKSHIKTELNIESEIDNHLIINSALT